MCESVSQKNNYAKYSTKDLKGRDPRDFSALNYTWMKKAHLLKCDCWTFLRMVTF